MTRYGQKSRFILAPAPHHWLKYMITCRYEVPSGQVPLLLAPYIKGLLVKGAYWIGSNIAIAILEFFSIASPLVIALPTFR